MKLLIIGAGPGGYETALAAAKRGVEVVLVEAGPVGGTCLNEGCIPTKSFCKNAQLLMTAAEIGVRESRMIEGEYILTQEDLVSCVKFEDSITACNYDIDIHNPAGAGTSHYYFPNGEYYTVPYRCLTPKGTTNLLTAGRCISSTHEAQASYRIMPTCVTLGEAAGTAAALAKKSECGVKEIDVKKLQEILVKNGAVI